jgi:hypothetical protein
MNIPFAGTAVKPCDSFNTAYGGVVVAGRRRGREEGSIYRRKDSRCVWVSTTLVEGVVTFTASLVEKWLLSQLKLSPRGTRAHL